MRRCCNYAHGVSVLSFSSNHRLLIGELRLGKLSETVVVDSNAPHDRPRFLVNHLIGNRARFLCMAARMVKAIPTANTNRADFVATVPLIANKVAL